MNKDLFDSMQQQMNPSPEVRAVLSERLARPVKRRIPVRKYVAVAACAALVIGSVLVYRLYQDQEKWMLITKNFHRDAQVLHPHSYVLMDGLETGIATEDAAAELYTEDAIEGGTEDNSGINENERYHIYPSYPSATESAPTSGTGAQNDRPFLSQDEAIKLYDILCSHLRSRYGRQENFSPNWPDWYGGGYLDNDRPDHISRLTLVLVKDYDTPELRQEIYDFLGSDHVDFQSGKYALSHLLDLQKKIIDYPVIRAVFASSWTDEESNRLNLTLTEVTDEALLALAELDPEDDAIYVQAGKRIALDQAVDDMGEDLVHPIMPGGAVVPDEDQDLIAYEPYYDGSDYDLEHLPGELPEEKRPAITVQSVPEEEEWNSSTPVTYDPQTGETIVHQYPSVSNESEDTSSGSTRAYNPGA